MDELVADPVDEVDRKPPPRRHAWPARTRESRCQPRRCTAPQGRSNSQGVNLSNEQQADRAGPPCCKPRNASHAWPAAPLLAADSRRRQPQPVRNPADHNRCGGPGARSHHADVKTRPCRRPGRAPWAATPPAERAAALLRAADLLEAAHAAPAGPADARSGQERQQRRGRSSRGRGLLALLRRAGAEHLRQRQPHPAGPGGLHQPVELPARHLHGPGGRRTGRRATPCWPSPQSKPR